MDLLFPFSFLFSLPVSEKKRKRKRQSLHPAMLVAAYSCISAYYQPTCYHFVIYRISTTPFGNGIGIATSAKLFTGIWSSLTQGKTLSNSSYFVRCSLFGVCMHACLTEISDLQETDE